MAALADAERENPGLLAGKTLIEIGTTRERDPHQGSTEKLAIFTALTIPIAHTFWTMQEPMRTLEFYVVMEHITVIGALMVVAWKSAPAQNAVPAPALAARSNA